MPNYIPAKDADLATWAANFSNLITASPATYGLTAGNATTIAAVQAAWVSAYALVTSPSTKTPATVQAKNIARANLLAIDRVFAQAVANNPGVTSANKIALGVNPRVNTPTPVTAPTTYPVISIPSAIALGHVIRFRDDLASPSVKAKPAGAIAMLLFGSASATPITDPTLLNFLKLTTKSPLTAAWGSGDVGKKAYYAARWSTRTGLVGPWSTIVSFTIAG